jgi:hypothetical protein
MWDSAGGTAPSALQHKAAKSLGPKAAHEASAGESPSEGDGTTRPGEGDTSAELPVTVAEGTVSVTPDLDLLRGKDTVYPVYIDPPVGLGASERTVLSSDGDKFWQFDGDRGVGRCSVSGPYYCGSNYTNRMYFEFAPSKLSGKYVLDATFRAYETWSFSCTPHWVDLERTNNISEGTRWPGPAQLDQMGDRYVSAGRGDQCSPEQPNQWVEFNDNPEEPDENLKSTLRSFADGKISRLTLMLRSHDESDPDAWKRFDDNAELQVTYLPKPGVPTSVGVIPGDGTTAYCKPSSSDPLVVTRLDPMTQARVQTKVQPRSGEEKGSLQAEFWMERKQDDGTWDKVWSDYRPDSGWDPDGTLEKVRTTNRADGGLYRYKARTQSHWSYGGKAGDLFSSYSSWCHLRIDSTAPKAPQIIAGSPYKQCTPNLCDADGGPGVPGTFTFKPNTTDTDIVGYRWRLLTSAGGKEATGSESTVSVSPSLAGTQVLSVEAKDVRSRWGTPSEFTFKVKPAEGAVGRWHFSDGTPDSAVSTAADSAEEGTRHDAKLYNLSPAGGAGWSTRGRRGDGDYSLWLNDTADTGRRTGYAATASAAVNTKDSFTVSAWAYLADDTSNHVVMAAAGDRGSALTLYYSATYKKWVFNRTDRDKDSPAYIRSLADSVNPPTHVWTHLAGVFDTKGDTDKANDTIQLFVNGRPQGSPVRAAGVASTYEPWVASGGLQFGRSKADGAYGELWRGLVDEAAVWQRALTNDEILLESAVTQDGSQATELVAQWDATSAAGTEIADRTAYPVDPLKLSPSGAVLDADDNQLTLDGATGYASTTGPVVDETASFTVTARVRLDSAKFADKPVGYRAQVAGQATPAGSESSWSLWAEKAGDGAYLWRFGRTAVDGGGKVVETASVPAQEPAALDTWVQVTGVFDATESWNDGTTEQYGKNHLYVGEFNQLPDDKAGFSSSQQGTGALAAGRGSATGTTGHYLPGGLEEIRVWTGAMSADQVRSQVLGAA